MNSLSSSKYGLLGKDDPLLVIIDMQQRLVPAMTEKERLVENVLRLVKVSRILGIPVILTEQQKLGATLPEIRAEIEEVRAISKLAFDGLAIVLRIQAGRRDEQQAGVRLAAQGDNLPVDGSGLRRPVAQASAADGDDVSFHLVSWLGLRKRWRVNIPVVKPATHDEIEKCHRS